jgi:hypothetical protein
MGTRGTFGVRINGKDKLMYNHFDSYPSGLGCGILTAVKKILKRKTGLQWLKKHAERLRLVPSDSVPTEEEKELLRPYADLRVSNQSEDDWYCLLRNLQGDLTNTLKVGIGIDSSNFITDSLFCEWGYIINLDDDVLEVYKGFQKDPHNKGRYGNWKPDAPAYKGGAKYFACALVATFPLSDLPSDDVFQKTCDPREEEEEE